MYLLIPSLVLAIVLAIVLILSFFVKAQKRELFVSGGIPLIILEYFPLTLKKHTNVVPLLKGDSLTFNKNTVVKTYPEIIKSFHKQNKNNSGQNKEYHPNLLPMIWNSLNEIINNDFIIRNRIDALSPKIYKLGEKLIKKMMLYRISDSDIKFRAE
tara:strand:- start:60 stop:527 length:468 start_codon:yes stop_codon:yes gene_type:complete